MPVRKSNPLLRERTGPQRKVALPALPAGPAVYQPSVIHGEQSRVGWFVIGSTTGKDPMVFTDKTRFVPEAGPFPHLMQALEYLPWHELDWPRVAVIRPGDQVSLLYGWEVMARHWFLLDSAQQVVIHLAS